MDNKDHILYCHHQLLVLINKENVFPHHFGVCKAPKIHDFMHLCVRDVHKARDVPIVVKLRMNFDSTFSLTKLRPREGFKTEVNGCGI